MLPAFSGQQPAARILIKHKTAPITKMFLAQMSVYIRNPDLKRNIIIAGEFINISKDFIRVSLSDRITVDFGNDTV